MQSKKTYQPIFDFESALADYTGAPYVVATDGCTHSIMLAMKLYGVKKCECTAFTYLSVIQALQHINVDYTLTDEQWIGEYQFHSTNIWDSARKLEPKMYRKNQIQCLSFGINKPMSIGKVGAILLDDEKAYVELSKMRADGRDLKTYPLTGATEWSEQQQFKNGYHFCPTLDDCTRGIEMLKSHKPESQQIIYPDCRKLVISTE